MFIKQRTEFCFCIVVMVLATISGCQREEPLEPPYEDRAIVVVSDRDYVPFLLSSINEAEEYIHIIMYLMKYYPQDTMNGVSQLQKALIAAVQQDVDVKVILEKSDYNSSLNAANESTFTYLDSMGVSVRFDPVSVTTHAKLIVIDDRVAYIGSSNWSISALQDNNEVNAKICQDEIAEICESYFNNIWSVSSNRLR